MANQGRVTIKFNHKSEDRVFSTVKQQEMMMTEWNIKRILVAIAVLLFIILLPVYIFTVDSYETELDDSVNQQQVLKQVSAEPEINNPVSAVEMDHAEVVVKTTVNRKKEEGNKSTSVSSLKLPAYKESSKKIIVPSEDTNDTLISKNNSVSDLKKQKQPLASVNKSSNQIKGVEDNAIYSNALGDSRVARALLTTGLNNKEPIDKITLPVNVNKLIKTKLYYFTDIRGMKDKSLFHLWLWEGQPVFKREIKIGGQRWRASTNKLIPYTKPGVWTVRLVNKENDILNEIKFKVIKK